MLNNRPLIVMILATIVMSSVCYALSGQYVLAIAMMIGLFPVVMSIAGKRR